MNRPPVTSGNARSPGPSTAGRTDRSPAATERSPGSPRPGAGQTVECPVDSHCSPLPPGRLARPRRGTRSGRRSAVTAAHPRGSAGSVAGRGAGRPGARPAPRPRRRSGPLPSSRDARPPSFPVRERAADPLGEAPRPRQADVPLVHLPQASPPGTACSRATATAWKPRSAGGQDRPRLEPSSPRVPRAVAFPWESARRRAAGPRRVAEPPGAEGRGRVPRQPRGVPGDSARETWLWARKAGPSSANQYLLPERPRPGPRHGGSGSTAVEDRRFPAVAAWARFRS